MNKYDLVAFIILVPTVAATTVTLVSLWLKHRRLPAAPGAGSAAVDARLARIEQAVDSIAVEVERISEAQRFQARLLAEGRADALPAAAHHREDRIRG